MREYYQISGTRQQGTFQYSTPYEHPRCRYKSSKASRKRPLEFVWVLGQKEKGTKGDLIYLFIAKKPFQEEKGTIGDLLYLFIIAKSHSRKHILPQSRMYLGPY